jgi:uncharacterized protein involved in exopolysaccharide biosynthesis
MDKDLTIDRQFNVFLEYIAIFKRYKYIILSIVITGLILSVLVAINLPHMYKSTATILINQEGMPENVVKSMITNYAEQRIEVINQKIMSSKNLAQIINELDLYKEERKKNKSNINDILKTMRTNTHMEMLGGKKITDPRSGKLIQPTIGFTLSFDNKSPKIAQKVTDKLVNLYFNENIKQRSKIIEGATTFLELETNKLGKKVSILEKKLARFKKINAKNLPDRNIINLGRVDRMEQQIIEVNDQIRSLSEKEINLNHQLSYLDPNITSFTSKGERIYGIDDRLIGLKAEYATLSSKYSRDHPDLVKIRKEISSLEKESDGSINRGDDYHTTLERKQAKLALLMDRYSSNHPDVKKLKKDISNLKKLILKSGSTINKIKRKRPNNPAYVQLQTQLISIQAELNSFRTSKRDLKNRIQFYEKNMSKSPEVEREYQSLMRNYENAVLRYQTVKSKQMEATMSQSMENISKGNEFLLLEQPLVPKKPFKPNRKAIAFLGSLASIFIALGFVVVKETFSPLIYTPGRLASITGMQPLVIIPYLESNTSFKKKYK